MTFIGAWQSTSLSDRELVFCADGTGHVSVQGERFPFFEWWLDAEGRLHWQMFRDASRSSVLSRGHDAACEVVEGGAELVFEHAPIPFGLKRFKRGPEV
jgi:hypothetical protein